MVPDLRRSRSEKLCVFALPDPLARRQVRHSDATEGLPLLRHLPRGIRG